MNPILKKLHYKGQDPVLLMNAPEEFKKNAKDFTGKVHASPKGKYSFALLFVKSLEDGKKIAKILGKILEAGAILWIAYPKGTSKKYKSDYNRDSGYALMAEFGLDGVSLVALDEDWSAMRFKISKS